MSFLDYFRQFTTLTCEQSHMVVDSSVFELIYNKNLKTTPQINYLLWDVEGGGCAGFSYSYTFNALNSLAHNELLNCLWQHLCLNLNNLKTDILPINEPALLYNNNQIAAEYFIFVNFYAHKVNLQLENNLCFENFIKLDLNKFMPLMVLVPKICNNLLEGATLSYGGNLMGKALMVSNPQAKRGCGCGSSFNIN